MAVEDALAGVEAGKARYFGLVVGVDHYDDSGDHGYADEPRDHCLFDWTVPGLPDT